VIATAAQLGLVGYSDDSRQTVSNAFVFAVRR
jgi:hypothetical protein